MSAIGILRFVELICSSNEFADLYKQRPGEAVMGFDLTEDETRALITRDETALEKYQLKDIIIKTGRLY